MLNPEIAVNRRPIDSLSRSARLGALAGRVQPRITAIVAGLAPAVRNVLHGTVFGHPLHAIVTDVPVGAWTVTAALDLLELGGGPGRGSDAALVVGLAGAGGAIVSGWADWSDTTGGPRTLGMAHAILNGAAVSAYIASLGLRRMGRRRPGIVAALVGYGFVGISAYIGGELSYGLLLGAKHTAEPLSPPEEFTPILALAELPSTQPIRREVNGLPVLLSRTADGVAAISAVCTHRGAPLDQGAIVDGYIRCPWHGSLFSLEDGHVVCGPATFPQPRFEARITGDQIEIRALSV